MARRQTGGRLRAMIFLIVSVVAAIVASLVIYTVLNNLQSELETASKPVEKVDIVVAAKELPQGRAVVLDDLTLLSVPPDFVPDKVFKIREEVIGRVPRERILAHEYVRQERLADSEAGVGMNAIIPRGMRAVSINISNGSAVSGFLNPGNYVDILVTIANPEKQVMETRTMLQAVTVLAVNNRLAEGVGATDQQAPSVTLALTPEQAEAIAHAYNQGSVTLTLRNDIDVTHRETHGELAKEDQKIGSKGAGGRISVQEWKKASEKSGGGLIIIRGKTTTQERSGN